MRRAVLDILAGLLLAVGMLAGGCSSNDSGGSEQAAPQSNQVSPAPDCKKIVTKKDAAEATGKKVR